MAMTDYREYLALVPAVRHAPEGYLWSSYDAEADVLYINFKKPSVATDSELTDDDIIVRFDGDDVIWLRMGGSRSFAWCGTWITVRFSLDLPPRIQQGGSGRDHGVG